MMQRSVDDIIPSPLQSKLANDSDSVKTIRSPQMAGLLKLPDLVVRLPTGPGPAGLAWVLSRAYYPIVGPSGAPVPDEVSWNGIVDWDKEGRVPGRPVSTTIGLIAVVS